MCIGLVSNVPDNLILWQITDQMQCHRKLYNAKIGSQMSSCLTDLLYKEFTDLSCKTLQFLTV